MTPSDRGSNLKNITDLGRGHLKSPSVKMGTLPPISLYCVVHTACLANRLIVPEESFKHPGVISILHP